MSLRVPRSAYGSKESALLSPINTSSDSEQEQDSQINLVAQRSFPNLLLRFKKFKNSNPYNSKFIKQIDKIKNSDGQKKIKINSNVIIDYFQHKNINRAVELIINEQWDTIYCLLKSVHVTEVEPIAQKLLAKMNAQQATEFIKYTISQEIPLQNKDIPFREHSIASVFVALMYIKTLIPRFKTRIQKIIDLLPRGNIEFKKEIVKSKKKRKLVIKKIKSNFIKILHQITKLTSSNKIPKEIKEINQHTYTEINFNIDSTKAEILKSLWFIQSFLNPILSKPKAFLPLYYTFNLKKGGIIISKLLQNLANNTLPGIKEKHMKIFDKFLFTKKIPHNNSTATIKEIFDQAINHLYPISIDDISLSTSESSEYFTDEDVFG